MVIQRILILAIAIQLVESQEETIYQPSISSQSNHLRFASAETMNKTVRAIIKKVLSVEQAEGVGAHVRRSVGRHEVGF